MKKITIKYVQDLLVQIFEFTNDYFMEKVPEEAHLTFKRRAGNKMVVGVVTNNHREYFELTIRKCGKPRGMI